MGFDFEVRACDGEVSGLGGGHHQACEYLIGVFGVMGGCTIGIVMVLRRMRGHLLYGCCCPFSVSCLVMRMTMHDIQG